MMFFEHTHLLTFWYTLTEIIILCLPFFVITNCKHNQITIVVHALYNFIKEYIGNTLYLKNVNLSWMHVNQDFSTKRK